MSADLTLSFSNFGQCAGTVLYQLLPLRVIPVLPSVSLRAIFFFAVTVIVTSCKDEAGDKENDE
jgi:hypothetical protein